MKYDEIIDDESGFAMPTASKFDVFKLFSLKNKTIVITGSAQGIGRVPKEFFKAKSKQQD